MSYALHIKNNQSIYGTNAEDYSTSRKKTATGAATLNKAKSDKMLIFYEFSDVNKIKTTLFFITTRPTPAASLAAKIEECVRKLFFSC